MEVGTEKEPKTQELRIPKENSIALSVTDKLINNPNVNINIEQSEISPLKLLLERAGWNQTTADLKTMISHGNNGYFLATYRYGTTDIPLGSGQTLPVSDEMCWIGMILVHPELRRQGIARAIMNACLKHTRLTQNKSIIGLDATPLGKQVYDDLGFKDSFTIWRSIVSTQWKKNPFYHAELRPFENDSVLNYLQKKNYTERLAITEVLVTVPESKNWMALSENGIQGFVMSRPGRLKPFVGPLIADTKEVAAQLLHGALSDWKKLGYKEVFVDVPEKHIGANSLFIQEDAELPESNMLQIPIKPVRSFVRMYQVISPDDMEKYFNRTQKDKVQLASAGYEKTISFMEKERWEIVPVMYATAGPEWS